FISLTPQSSPLYCLLLMLPPLRSTLFPYTTLFRSGTKTGGTDGSQRTFTCRNRHIGLVREIRATRAHAGRIRGMAPREHHHRRRDRKSTRLNSSHVSISYAVFCLKKKKQPHSRRRY